MMVSLAIALLISLLAQTSIALVPLSELRGSTCRSKPCFFDRGGEQDVPLAQKLTPVDKPFVRKSHSIGRIVAVALPFFWSFGVSPPQQASAADVARGATLFTANCAGCHAGGQNFVKEKKTLQKEALQKYLGSTEAVQIQDFVQNGMPHKLLAMRIPMDTDSYADVATYVSEQALGDKW
jgi:cytochrome c6